MKNIKKQQLEIGFNSACRRPMPIRQRRATRARWWFSQMRRVVDDAIDWQPAPSLPPEQIRLPLAQGS